jgi:hypothetical protein
LSTERWLSVARYEGVYEVSDLGRVRSMPRPRTKGGFLKPGKCSGSYALVVLCKGGIERSFRVHTLVLEALLARAQMEWRVVMAMATAKIIAWTTCDGTRIPRT